MGLDENSSISPAISALVSEKRWDKAQVKIIQTVTPSAECYSSWNETKMEKIGGRSIFSKVCNKSKAGKETSKRNAEEESMRAVKKHTKTRFTAP